MTRSQIVSRVAKRLNLTSQTALDRIADDVNERYNYVLGAVGLTTANRGLVTANSVIGSRYITFPGVTKLLAVSRDSGPPPLNEVLFDELRNQPVKTDPPRTYAIASMTADSITIFMDVQAATVYPLFADARLASITLGPADAPAFPESFHDILVHGAMAVELDKMEKADRVGLAEQKFESRLGELRLYVQASAYLQIYQGKTEYAPLRVV